MAPLSPQSQAILSAFSHQPGVTADQATNLQAAIQSSPALVDEFNLAVAQGHLRQIVPLNNPHAGGEYNGTDKAMNLPLDALTTGSSAYSPGNVVFVLGHELQHGLNDAATKQATQTFYDDARKIAKGSAAVHDYTATVNTLIAANRHDEASAEIAGWNAIVGNVKTAIPDPTLGDIYNAEPSRMRDFIERSESRPYTYTLKPNLTLNSDLTLSSTPANVEGMGKNYFDHSPQQSRLGYRGSSDYANYYGAYAMSVIGQLERQYHAPQHGDEPARVTLDMASLRLSENLMEENGINLGSNTQPLPYMDRSTTPPTLHHFDHTITTHTYVPIQAQAQEPEAAARMAPTRLDDPAHAGNAMFLQGVDGVQLLNAKHGVAADATRDANLGGSLAIAAAASGLTRIDHVALSDDAKYAFAVQGELHDVFQPPMVARVDTASAINTPLEQSSEQWPQVVQQAQQLKEQQAQAQQHVTPVQTTGMTL